MSDEKIIVPVTLQPTQIETDQQLLRDEDLLNEEHLRRMDHSRRFWKITIIIVNS